jgi:hypothetical protein
MLDLVRSSEMTLASQSLVDPWLVGQLVADQLLRLEPVVDFAVGGLNAVRSVADVASGLEAVIS